MIIDALGQVGMREGPLRSGLMVILWYEFDGIYFVGGTLYIDHLELSLLSRKAIKLQRPTKPHRNELCRQR
jgi:hypothetical protein